MSSNGRVEVKKGSSVRLECRASGNPVPKITWSRKNNILPSGDQTTVTPVLALDRVDRHQAGVYQCMASNGVGEDVTEQINLHVLCEYGFFIIYDLLSRPNADKLILHRIFFVLCLGQSNLTEIFLQKG